VKGARRKDLSRRRSKRRWGRVAFGTGLAVCVAGGAVVGVLLGTGESRDEGDEIRRVASLALDASGLNNDALALSRAIEEAIARDELESEAVALRTELARIEARSGRIQARAGALAGSSSPTDAPAWVSSGREGRAVGAGLRRIEASLAVLERQVVTPLNTVLSEPPAAVTDPTALAEVVTTLENQERALTALAESLERGEESEIETIDRDEDEGPSVSGAFQSALVTPSRPLEVDYELRDLDLEVDEGGEPGVALFSGVAAGELTVANAADRRVDLELSPLELVLYWEESRVPPTVSLDGGPTDPIEGSADRSSSGEGNEVADAPCAFEFDGEPHCALARLTFSGDVPGDDGLIEVELGHGDDLTLDQPESGQGLAINARDADAVADLFTDGTPDLVAVVTTAPQTDLRPACVVSEAVGPEETDLAGEGREEVGTVLALLDGSGEAFFEVEDPDEPMRADRDVHTSIPECYSAQR